MISSALTGIFPLFTGYLSEVAAGDSSNLSAKKTIVMSIESDEISLRD